MSECLVVPRNILEKVPFWSKLKTKNGVLYDAIHLDSQEISNLLEIIKNNHTFLERKGVDSVEYKPEWQQIIFYAFIVRGNKFFVYKRSAQGSGSAEGRLSSKLSAGIGGHIEPYDADLISSLYRELNEELIFSENGNEINFAGEIKILGVIKDDGNVGGVHLGLACLLKIEDEDTEVKIRNEENVEGWFTNMNEYKNLVESGEYTPEEWTTLLINNLIGDLNQLRV